MQTTDVKDRRGGVAVSGAVRRLAVVLGAVRARACSSVHPHAPSLSSSSALEHTP